MLVTVPSSLRTSRRETPASEFGSALDDDNSVDIVIFSFTAVSVDVMISESIMNIMLVV